jgi:hypothetical protein
MYRLQIRIQSRFRVSTPRSLCTRIKPPTFALEPEFVALYAERQPPFGFNGLGELVYIRCKEQQVNNQKHFDSTKILHCRTYSRRKTDGLKERWHETVERVINGEIRLAHPAHPNPTFLRVNPMSQCTGTFRMQQEWHHKQNLPWNTEQSQKSAQVDCTHPFIKCPLFMMLLVDAGNVRTSVQNEVPTTWTRSLGHGYSYHRKGLECSTEQLCLC